MTTAAGGVGPLLAPADAQGDRVPAVNGHAAASSWTALPALSWVYDAATANLEMRAANAAGQEPVAALIRHEALSDILVAQLRGTAAPLYTVAGVTGLDGRPRQLLIAGFPVVGERGTQLAGVAIDVTGQQARIDELAKRATHDELTGLYSRRGFLLLAEHELKLARRRGTRSAIVVIELDASRRTEAAADDVLVGVAAVLRGVFRECDVIGRLGGEAFALFVGDLHATPAPMVKRLRSALELAGGAVALRIGMAWAEADPALGAGDLLAMAQDDKARAEAGVSSSAGSRS